MKSYKRVKVDVSRCDFCGVCVGVCFQNAIIMKEMIIFIDNEKCNECYWCADVCPLGAIRIDGMVKDFLKKERRN